MGYYAHIRDHSLRITNTKRALELLHEADFDGRDIEEILYHNGYEDTEIGDDGRIETLIFNNKYRGDQMLWEALAPVIASEDGKTVPFIEWQGEDNELWRYVFEHGAMTEVGCDIVWPYLGQIYTVPAVVEPLAITTLAGRTHLMDALSRELHETIRNPQLSNEIRMALKSIEDAQKVVLNLEVIE